MQLKRFEAPNMQEACRKIKSELGDDAVIFSTRTVGPQGRAGTRKHASRVEVTAAIERKKKIDMYDGRDDGSSRFSAGDCEAGQNDDKQYGLDAAGPLSDENGIVPHCLKDQYESMVHAGFNRERAWFLLGETYASFKNNGDGMSVYDILIHKVGCRLPVKGPIRVTPGVKKAAALIGPTGVGKTTTIAKIAAQCLRDYSLQVKIITIDTYRIAAVEQMRVYARILGVPFAVAESPEMLKDEVQQNDGSDIVLIDTPGSNLLVNDNINELRRWLECSDLIESHLLLSATSSEDVLAECLMRVGCACADYLIVTKMDERIQKGRLFDVISTSSVPLSYITTGQRVPEDIRPATARLLSSMMLKGTC